MCTIERLLLKNQRLKKSAHVGILFQKLYPVTLLKWGSAAEIFGGMSQLLSDKFFLKTLLNN